MLVTLLPSKSSIFKCSKKEISKISSISLKEQYNSSNCKNAWIPYTSLISHLAICSTRTFLNDVPISLKHLMTESLSFNRSNSGSISPVTYKLWQLVSTRSSIFVKV